MIHIGSLNPWRPRSATVCFTCVRNIVFQHNINVCVDVQVSAWCVFRVWLRLICVSFKIILGSCVFTLSLRCYWAHGEFKWFQISVSWTRKFPDHMLALICWAVLNHRPYPTATHVPMPTPRPTLHFRHTITLKSWNFALPSSLLRRSTVLNHRPRTPKLTLMYTPASLPRDVNSPYTLSSTAQIIWISYHIIWYHIVWYHMISYEYDIIW